MTIKSNVKVFLDNLSITDKVDILKELYKDISGLGVDGDTQLAHINSSEADLLRSVGGAGTLHITTGLPQYKGGGGGGPSSVYQTTNQTSRLSEEAAPFAKDVLTEAQDYYRGIVNQGYDPYTGAISAPQTQEQIDAQAGIKGLAGTGTALQQEGLDLYRQQGEEFTPEVAAEYQSPYQQAVTDVEKRKAVEDFERNIMPQFESQAVQAGGMSGLGSRAGVQAGILGENLQTRLGDIQARGLQSSYMDAQKLFQDQKRREQAQAGAVAALGPASFGQGLAEQGAIQTVGEQKQGLAQSALDEQYYKYLEQKAFPEEQLAKYSGFVYGNPLLSERDVSSTASSPGAQGPSFGQQALGVGAGLANTFRQFNQPAGQSTGANTFGQSVRRAGGGGLSDIVYRQENGQTSPENLEPDAAEREAPVPPPVNPPVNPAVDFEKYNLTEEGLKNLAAAKRQIVENYAEKRKGELNLTRGGVDRTGILLKAISDSLLSSKSGDPRELESTRTSTLLRVMDGLKTGNISVLDAEAKLRKLAREDQKEVSKIEDKVPDLEIKLLDAVQSLPTTQQDLAAKIMSSNLSRREKFYKIMKLKREAEGGTPRSAIYKPYTRKELRIAEDELNNNLEYIVFSDNPQVNAVAKKHIEDLDSAGKKIFLQKARQEMYNNKNLNDMTKAMILAYQKLGKQFFINNK